MGDSVVEAIPTDCNWQGFLTCANVDAVASRLAGLLHGRHYAVADWTEGLELNLHTSVRLNRVTASHQTTYKFLSIHDTSGWSWMWMTSFADRAEAVKMGRRHHHAVWIEIQHSNFRIECETPSGHKSVHVFRLEDHSE